MMYEAVILAGGLGTRLRNVIGDYPKPMAKIDEKPFLWFLLKMLSKANFKRVILAVGYKKEIIINYFGSYFENTQLVYSSESIPLGTGGALKQAINFVLNDNFFLLNGDSYFNINFSELLEFHLSKRADVSIALKYMEDCRRFGVVTLDENERVINFVEKNQKNSGLINGGIYLINKIKISEVLNKVNKLTFSFEKDILETYVKVLNIYGKIFDRFFIDIGIPEDYERAKTEFVKLCN